MGGGPFGEGSVQRSWERGDGGEPGKIRARSIRYCTFFPRSERTITNSRADSFLLTMRRKESPKTFYFVWVETYTKYFGIGGKNNGERESLKNVTLSFSE